MGIRNNNNFQRLRNSCTGIFPLPWITSSSLGSHPEPAWIFLHFHLSSTPGSSIHPEKRELLHSHPMGARSKSRLWRTTLSEFSPFQFLIPNSFTWSTEQRRLQRWRFLPIPGFKDQELRAGRAEAAALFKNEPMNNLSQDSVHVGQYSITTSH